MHAQVLWSGEDVQVSKLQKRRSSVTFSVENVTISGFKISTLKFNVTISVIKVAISEEFAARQGKR